MTDYYLTTSYACGLIAINEQFVVIETCPIYKWMIHKRLDTCLHYLASKKQFIDIQLIGE